jgi:aerobic-type carbon monoxide dehydrogenase small subunit (CoxS/CutS family)
LTLPHHWHKRAEVVPSARRGSRRCRSPTFPLTRSTQPSGGAGRGFRSPGDRAARRHFAQCGSIVVANRPITTIEGRSGDNTLHALQAAFIEHDGLQCGYCTPGQICSAIGMTDEFRRGVPSVLTSDLAQGARRMTRDGLRERMSCNLCRCGAHNGIVDAIDATFYPEAAE